MFAMGKIIIIKYVQMSVQHCDGFGDSKFSIGKRYNFYKKD